MSTVSDGGSSRIYKRMRKGTRSCGACRQRKIKCVYPIDDSACNECIQRGTTCIEQGQSVPSSTAAESNRNVREWLSKIDLTLGNISRKVDLLCNGNTLPNAQSDLEKLRIGLLHSTIQSSLSAQNEEVISSGQAWNSQEASPSLADDKGPPLLNLIDNGVIHARRMDPVNLQPQKTQSQSGLHGHGIASLLKALIPSQADFLSVVRASRCAWEVWDGVHLAASHFSNSQIDQDRNAHYSQHISSLLATEDESVLTKLLFGLAICMQQLPRDFNFSQTRLPATPEALQHDYITAAESVLAVNQGLVNSIDGLECMMIQSKYYVNLGKPRVAWLIGQRALSIFHIFGVHGRFQGEANTTRARWEVVWLKTWAYDRQLSLLLGLPYANSLIWHDIDKVRNDNTNQDTQWDPKAFAISVGLFCGQVIDRNLVFNEMSFSQTMIVDQNMETFKQTLPLDWWSWLPDPGNPSQGTERVLLSRFTFHNIRKHLHLPYMLKAMTDKRFERSRSIALEASREMIRIFLFLRDPLRPVFTLCNVEDFLVFTAALVIAMDLLAHLSKDLRLEDAESDWMLVHDVVTVFTRISLERGCSVAVQGSRLLSDMLEARHSFPRNGTYEATIPYFGRIALARNEQTVPERRLYSNTSLSEYDNQESMDQAKRNSSYYHDDATPNTQTPQDTIENFLQWSPAEAEWPSLQGDLDDDWNDLGRC